MRPLLGDDAFEGRSRSTSLTDNDTTPLATRSQPLQMTYFLSDENAIGEASGSTSAQSAKQRESPKGSTYGVESLESTVGSLSQDNEDMEDKLRKARHNWKKELQLHTSKNTEGDIIDPGSASSVETSGNASPVFQRRSSQATISRPFTPLSLGSAAPPSIMSSSDSRRNSDAGSLLDEISSQAILSSGEEDREMPSEVIDSGSAPQLVMPSIKMPSRRPFTEKGKSMGRLKVLIAGDSGVGKTSLIKAIVQICEDIVHVDPLATTPIALPTTLRKSSKSKSRHNSSDVQSTQKISEVYASTRAYPTWWSDLEESRILRRRKSMGDSVLERNLCFVDTPGYGNRNSVITPVVDYIESQIRKVVLLEDMSDSEMIGMLSGNGGSQVDLVFYVFDQKVKAVDIEYLRRLSPLTNIIPLISGSETMSSNELSTLKEVISSELESNNIRPFALNMDPNVSSQPGVVYAITTKQSKDEETMDASLLMSPDYVQPLIPSELSYLVSRVFERDTISWLRHSAAKKFINWRDSESLRKPQSLYRPISQTRSLVSASQSLTAPVGATTSYALARITDHTQREEKMAQVRLANWAADLQRSLQNERLRYERLAHADRAVWLTERLGECVQDGAIVPISQARRSPSEPLLNDATGALVRRSSSGKKSRRQHHPSTQGMNPHDPLGLLALNEQMKRKSLFMLRVLGSVGVFGGLAFWITRHFQTTDIDTEVGLVDWLARMGMW